MSIRDVHINSNRTEHIRNGYVNGTGKPDGQSAPVAKAEQVAANAKDRVEISDAGRAAANDKETRELNFARKALDSVQSLSAERADDIRKRMQDGYYTQPEVISKIAQAVVQDLSSNRQI